MKYGKSGVNAIAYSVNERSVSGNIVLDISSNNIFELTLSGDTTVSFNTTTSDKVISITIIFKQDNIGGKRIILPSSIYYPKGINFFVTRTAGAVDLVEFISFDGGTNWNLTNTKNNYIL